MASSSTRMTDDAADTAVRLYGDLVLALRKLETDVPDHEVGGNDGEVLVARIRDLCAELEQLLDACEGNAGEPVDWVFQRIEAIQSEVSRVLRRVRSLVERGRTGGLDNGWQ